MIIKHPFIDEDLMRRMLHKVVRSYQLFVGNWSPDKFTSVCQTALEKRETEEDGGRLYQLCNEVASAEWKLLFDSCIKVVNDP